MTTLPLSQKRSLVTALLACPTLQTRQGREDVVRLLPEAIQYSIQRRDDAKSDVTNILERCLNYAGGLQNLLEALNFYEDNSLSFQEVLRQSGSPEQLPVHYNSAEVGKTAILAKGLVAILNSKSLAQGAGFLVSNRLILTCAHVVTAVNGGPGQTVPVRFYTNGVVCSALVDASCWDTDTDLATLHLESDPPPGVTCLPLANTISCAGHTFSTLGFPQMGSYDSLAASGKIEVVISKAGLPMLQLTASQLTQGFSGAPVWDDALGQVVGMLAEVYFDNGDSKNRDTAFAIPAETLQRACDTVLTPQTPPENPFYTGGRIRDPRRFFGRQRLVREIRNELKKGVSVSLVGKSQIGKSSLLYYLYTTRSDWLPSPLTSQAAYEDITLAYIDLQRMIDEADFCETVLQEFGENGDNLRRLKHTLEKRHSILLFDEVERISAPDFSPRLHDLLRSLAQEPNFTMCLATQRPLEEVFPARTASGVSPFHNIFTHKIIGPFSKVEALDFLAVSLTHTGVVFTPSEIDRLLELSACHPARLQALAKTLFDRKTTG